MQSKDLHNSRVHLSTLGEAAGRQTKLHSQMAKLLLTEEEGDTQSDGNLIAAVALSLGI